MYKATHRSLRRQTREHVVDQMAAMSVHTESDFIPSADNMGLKECKDERTQLHREKTIAENAIIAAKSAGDYHLVDITKHKILSITSRLAVIGQRIKDLNRKQSEEDLREAINRVLPMDMKKLIFDAARDIRLEREGH